MQLVILIYHMTGASQVIPLYMQMRVLVSSYLFLTGYGHLSFFWNGGSASLSRLCQVWMRFSFIIVVECRRKSIPSFFLLGRVSYEPDDGSNLSVYEPALSIVLFCAVGYFLVPCRLRRPRSAAQSEFSNLRH